MALHKNDVDVKGYDPMEETMPGFAYISLLHVLPVPHSDGTTSFAL